MKTPWSSHTSHVHTGVMAAMGARVGGSEGRWQGGGGNARRRGGGSEEDRGSETVVARSWQRDRGSETVRSKIVAARP